MAMETRRCGHHAFATPGQHLRVARRKRSNTRYSLISVGGQKVIQRASLAIEQPDAKSRRSPFVPERGPLYAPLPKSSEPLPYQLVSTKAYSPYSVNR